MNKSKKIVFRADGNSSIGMGHFVRTLALADTVRGAAETVFCTQTPTEWQREQILDVCDDIKILPSGEHHFKAFLEMLEGDETVVLDNYYYDTEYQQAVRAKGCRVVCIDDMQHFHYAADIVINHALGVDRAAFSAEPYTQLCLGPEWALLRKPFFEVNNEQKKGGDTAETIFVCFGGVDYNGLTMRVLDAVLEIDTIKHVNVVIGKNFSFIDDIYRLYEHHERVLIWLDLSAAELCGVMQRSDLAIVPASTILWEAMAVGLPCIYGYYVDNQQGIVENVGNNAALGLTSVGDFNELTDSELRIIIENSISDFRKPSNPLQLGRTRENLRALLLGDISVRPADSGDMELLYEWANDPETRRNSCSISAITHDEHEAWFERSLVNSQRQIYICYHSGVAMGQVRFDADGECGECEGVVISISVAPQFRGRGLGGQMLTAAMRAYKPCGEVCFAAYVKPENVPSRRMFEREGFSKTASDIDNVLKFKHEKS